MLGRFRLPYSVVGETTTLISLESSWNLTQLAKLFIKLYVRSTKIAVSKYVGRGTRNAKAKQNNEKNALETARYRFHGQSVSSSSPSEPVAVLTTKLCIIPLSSSQIHDSRSRLRDTQPRAFCSGRVDARVRSRVCRRRGNRASIRCAIERFNDIQEDPFFCHRVSLKWPDKESLSIGAHDHKIVTRLLRLIYRACCPFLPILEEFNRGDRRWPYGFKRNIQGKNIS